MLLSFSDDDVHDKRVVLEMMQYMAPNDVVLISNAIGARPVTLAVLLLPFGVIG